MEAKNSMFEMFGTDANMEKDGIILDYGDFRVTIARAGGANTDYTKMIDRLTKPYMRAIKAETLPNEIAEEIFRKAYAHTIVKNFEVKRGENDWVAGIPQKGSAELLEVNTINVMATFEELPELFNAIREDAQKHSLFRKALLDEALGN